MKNSIILILVFTLGALVGGSLAWFKSYSVNAAEEPEFEIVGNISNYANVNISDENFHCESKSEKNVGSVLGGIIASNIKNNRNMMSFSCIQSVCSLTITNCKPWKSSECGNRILKFDLGEKNEILPNTFECIDVP